MSLKPVAISLLALICFSGCSPETPVPDTADPGNADTAAQVVQADRDPVGDAMTLSNFQWTGPVGDKASVRVYNPYGDIRCRASGEDNMIISAQIQSFTDWQAKPEFVVADDDGITEVSINHAQPRRALPGGDYQQGLAGRVDITLLLPDGASFDATTTDGAIRVKSFNGSLRAVSESGEIYYKSHGSLDLRNGSGNIDIVLRSFNASDSALISTVSGDIAVQMTPDVSATVNVTSAGKIDTAIIDAVTQHQTRSDDGLALSLGKAQRPVQIHSDSGNVLIAVDRSFSIDKSAD